MFIFGCLYNIKAIYLLHSNLLTSNFAYLCLLIIWVIRLISKGNDFFIQVIINMIALWLLFLDIKYNNTHFALQYDILIITVKWNSIKLFIYVHFMLTNNVFLKFKLTKHIFNIFRNLKYYNCKIELWIITVAVWICQNSPLNFLLEVLIENLFDVINEVTTCKILAIWWKAHAYRLLGWKRDLIYNWKDAFV